MINLSMQSNESSLSQRLPLDLLAVFLLTVLAAGLLLFIRGDLRGLRLIAGLALVTFLPGYALTAVLFPTTELIGAGNTSRGISWPRRYALSVVTSLILVAAVALALDPVGLAYTWERTTAGIAGLTGILTVVAAVRRFQLPLEQRLYVPVGNWYAHLRGLLVVDGKTALVLNVVLLLSVLLAAGGVTYALTGESEESVTELYLLTENEQGELVADDFPHEPPAGETVEVVVGIEGQVARGENYTVVVQTQRVKGDEGNLTVVSRQQVDQFQANPGADAQFRQPVQFSLYTAEQRYRVAFMLYRGEPPATPTLENAHREVHLVIDTQSRITRIERPDTGV